MWKGVVLHRPDDDVPYHAYVVSLDGVHDREGRYHKRSDAETNANSYALILNTNKVDEKRPFGHDPLDHEQGQQHWKLKET